MQHISALFICLMDISIVVRPILLPSYLVAKILKCGNRKLLANNLQIW